MTTPAEARIKRMRIRAWRRGIKEMDMILGGYADAELGNLDAEGLDLFEAVLGENDHDLFAWVTGQDEAPARFAPLMTELAARVPGGAR
ncbi:succinate dehydrogenase assembly factor 2 [uncultured Jannaschia sp.]|uniref:succinate dehydrogenase assembly factor 2 n=1 Tax=uncultured Jannaschia sp. TaxID=293347 RepID=UPI00262A0EE9|nr:succinate dehydrogenase assembly factor 2 [uncultured Jannaschia sp.]